MTEWGAQVILTAEEYERLPVRYRAEKMVREALADRGVVEAWLEWLYNPDPRYEDDEGNVTHGPPCWELSGWGEA